MADSVAAQQEIDSIIDDMQQEMVDTVMTKNADQRLPNRADSS